MAKFVEKTNTEKFVQLGTVEVGKTIRFASTSFKEAMEKGDFWIVLKPLKEDTQVKLVNYSGDYKICDKEHQVVVHEVTIQVASA